MKKRIDSKHMLLSYSSSVCSLLLAWNADVTAGAPATLLAHEATETGSHILSMTEEKGWRSSRPWWYILWSHHGIPGPSTSGIFFFFMWKRNKLLFCLHLFYVQPMSFTQFLPVTSVIEDHLSTNLFILPILERNLSGINCILSCLFEPSM